MGNTNNKINIEELNEYKELNIKYENKINELKEKNKKLQKINNDLYSYVFQIKHKTNEMNKLLNEFIIS
jgi:uncharacterized membrane protein YjjP (DUF1212 family)